MLALMLDTGLKFYDVPSWHTDLEKFILGAKRDSGELCCSATALIVVNCLLFWIMYLQGSFEK